MQSSARDISKRGTHVVVMICPNLPDGTDPVVFFRDGNTVFRVLVFYVSPRRADQTEGKTTLCDLRLVLEEIMLDVIDVLDCGRELFSLAIKPSQRAYFRTSHTRERTWRTPVG